MRPIKVLKKQIMFSDFGKEPIRSAILIAGVPYLTFVLGCVLASGLTYKNLSPVITTGGIIALVAFIVLILVFKKARLSKK